ncbi:helix-turn-helix domain-containing protein [Allohahella sp. A8]|uniref:helix-turn-helix domain-containing protein n=1 Tax=Allohahella sp. A8 TaxID=3141461 RepID=UPI003A7FF7FE
MNRLNSKPVFWRDPLMPYIELRKIDDGSQVAYAPHSHTQWSLGAITNGMSTFRCRDAEQLIKAGDLVLINPDWVHACNPIEDQPWAYVMIYVDTLWLTRLRFEAGLLPTNDWQDLSTAVISDSGWYEKYCQVADCLLDPEHDLLDKQSRLVKFLLGLMHELAKQPVEALPQTPEVMVKLATYLDGHGEEDVDLETLAEFSGLSPGHLIRAFKRYFGLTPHAYLVNRRVQFGQCALKSGAPIVNAALAAGFADQPHFQRTFKRLVAATPNEYRSVSINKQINATGRK